MPVFGDHFPGDRGGPLEVVGSAGGDIAEHQCLGNRPCQQGDNLLQHFITAHVAVILGGQGDGHAACHAPGHDGDLMHRIVGGQGVHHNGVAGLVDCGELLLMSGDHAAPFSRGLQ